MVVDILVAFAELDCRISLLPLATVGIVAVEYVELGFQINRASSVIVEEIQVASVIVEEIQVASVIVDIQVAFVIVDIQVALVNLDLHDVQ